jgi:hypothetical protein
LADRHYLASYLNHFLTQNASLKEGCEQACAFCKTLSSKFFSIEIYNIIASEPLQVFFIIFHRRSFFWQPTNRQKKFERAANDEPDKNKVLGQIRWGCFTQ